MIGRTHFWIFPIQKIAVDNEKSNISNNSIKNHIALRFFFQKDSQYLKNKFL